LNYIAKLFLNPLVCYRSYVVASGYDLSSKVPFRLMKGRLGIYEKQHYEPEGLEGIDL
jgi:hypothetical protein